MKTEYEELKMEVIAFETEDIIRASGETTGESGEDAIRDPIGNLVDM